MTSILSYASLTKQRCQIFCDVTAAVCVQNVIIFHDVLLQKTGFKQHDISIQLRYIQSLCNVTNAKCAKFQLISGHVFYIYGQKYNNNVIQR